MSRWDTPDPSDALWPPDLPVAPDGKGQRHRDPHYWRSRPPSGTIA